MTGELTLKTNITMEPKIIWKAFLIIGISAILFKETSCKKTIEDIKKINYIYKNESDVDLVMGIYNSDNEIFKSFVLINNNAVETNTTAYEVPTFFHFEGVGNMIGDSVVVRFNDNKCLNYSRNSGVDIYGDDLFDARKYDNYTSELVEKDEYTLYYTFTQEDYNSSNICN
tara:strand:+ start:106 stop:618 length:513 start_codon:yes stop_codon:yes gene_type:complete